jgi:hypothetical protein
VGKCNVLQGKKELSSVDILLPSRDGIVVLKPLGKKEVQEAL